MTGGEKILDRILSDADVSCAQIRQTAQTRADEIQRQADAEAAEKAATIAAEAEKTEARIKAAADSAAQLLVRNALLACRREEIEKTLDQALAALLALPDTAYFETLLRLLDGNLQTGDGVLRLCAKDLARLPEDFEKQLKARRVTLAKEPVAIDGGFVLVYGEIEQNCAFSALLAERRDALEDSVNRDLFV